MNFFKLSMLVVLTATLALGGTGCKKPGKNLTPIPSGQTGGPQVATDTTQRNPVVPRGAGLGDNTNPRANDTSITLPTTTEDSQGKPLNPLDLESYDRNPDFFKANTVYFDYDRATVKVSERVRVEEVAAYLKGKPTHMVQIEGHCDERGTEEYNRALGERRALAVREYLINSGVQPERVHTISFGEDRPAEIGSSEGAWAKNRRGEFILLTPKK
jgi:peptidoglycan-associated lipoprotein